MTAATMASTLSTPLTPTIMGAGRDAGVGRAGGAGTAAATGLGAAKGAAGAVVTAAAGAAGVAAILGVGAATPPVPGVGILIVGAAVGLGGKLMRTVSFLGCTLAASAGLGGTPAGGFGVGSAIHVVCAQPRIRTKACQMVIPKKTGRHETCAGQDEECSLLRPAGADHHDRRESPPDEERALL